MNGGVGERRFSVRLMPAMVNSCPGDVAQDLVGLGLAVQLALLFLAVIVRREASRLVQAAQQHVDRPVFLRTKASISCSRSTTRRVATDCTRPADRPRRIFFHSSGLSW